ncbi:helix-turn-helix domain-containing protein [Streptomyces sp. 4503]|uniref:Helix-turn-helix domain-containing protein n=1 Tax=Streptomyces niphimycinicus TaxID=2842201 RepID=A0ABS6CFQ5_9ACTN|nr:helix-turn-helix domain-containing protein [Streptomyces niphimycinicus]MBU3865690.1 helix-turn-helix domain-containing protein [Streptomyces niphimycinicus]
MLRVHFSELDLARLRMAVRPDALWETVLSFHRLRENRAESVYGKWRSEARNRLNGEARLLAPLIPSRGYFPDFLTPAEGVIGCDAAMSALRATPGERLNAELAGLPAARALPGWIRDLGEGERKPLDRLIGTLRAYHQAAVAPYWPHIQARIEADRVARGRALLDGGADGLLASLPPTMRWRAPVLEVDYPVDRDLRLRGRGLLLLPSFFCRGTPVTFRNPDLTPVLVYPVEHAPCGLPLRPGQRPALASGVGPRPGAGAASASGAGSARTLGKLVGQTRSAVLLEVSGGCTTSELARRVGVSLASASQHASVLREAGLVHTLRQGSAVLHTLTPLGAALLRGGAPGERVFGSPAQLPPVTAGGRWPSGRG